MNNTLYKFLIITYLAIASLPTQGQNLVSVSGRIIDQSTQKPLEFASINSRGGLWSISDAEGNFKINNLPKGQTELQIRFFGYVPQTVTCYLTKDTIGMVVQMQQESLKLQEVTITSQKRKDGETTGYIIDRKALDHTQILNVGDVTALLPGGKTDGDISLVGDSRIALRSQGGTEMGNTSFGTAIEVDGVRLSNNATMSLTGASTRTVSSSNIESVEIITGIPSVEYGDLSNGVVKVNTRKGKTPYMIEVSTKPHTKLFSISKGWSLGSRNRRMGIVNASFERAKSISNLTSPYTDYNRNILTLNYSNRFGQRVPMLLVAGLTGNAGGYNSKSDPDAFSDTYSKVNDLALRGNLKLSWLLDKSWLSNLEISFTGSYADKKSEANTNYSTAAALPQIHTTEKGYFVAADYDDDPEANIILSPTGYHYRKSFVDNKPIDLAAHVKAQWNRYFTQDIESRLKVGMDYTVSGNKGRGNYYEDMRHTPTWREARYDTLPYLHNLSLYAEEHLEISIKNQKRLAVTAGLREDFTMIKGSEYGTASALAPRVNARLTIWENEEKLLSRLSIYGGYGKSVKLPSFQVLYPSTSYSDQLAFSPGSLADGRAYYAYYTIPSRAIYNNELKWQYSNQGEIGAEATVADSRISFSLYRNTTRNPYLSTYVYSPYEYRYTTQAALENSKIPSASRYYSIDKNTGIVTAKDATGVHQDETLDYSTKRTYTANTKYVNGSASTRTGIEWIVDFARIKAINTEVRWDGNLAYYKGVEHTLVQDRPSSTLTMANGQPYAYIGYYDGSATVGQGSLSRQLNTNITITTHVPAVRLIFSLRLESSLYSYRQNLQSNAIIPEDISSFEGQHSDNLSGNYVIVYPKYFSTWEEPNRLIPFEEAFISAKDNDRTLYNELVKLVAKSNTNYYFNGNKVSPYFTGNLSLTKEIGEHISISFQATNFWNNTSKVKTSQTDRETTLYGSGYVRSYYYGLAMRLRI